MALSAVKYSHYIAWLIFIQDVQVGLQIFIG